MPCLLYSIWDWGRRCSHLVAFPQLANTVKHYKHLETLLKGEREMGGRERVSRRKVKLPGQGQRHSAVEQSLPLPRIALLSGCNTHTWSVDLLGFPLWRCWHRRKESLKKTVYMALIKTDHWKVMTWDSNGGFVSGRPTCQLYYGAYPSHWCLFI